jgi:hypothetical protein
MFTKPTTETLVRTQLNNLIIYDTKEKNLM